MTKRQTSGAINPTALIGLGLAAVCTAACGLGILRPLSADRYVDQLPSSAKNIQKESFDLFPDWEYYLKVEIDEKDFTPYAESLSLSPHTEQRQYSDDPLWLSWEHHFSSPPWWDPSPDLTNTFVWQKDHVWVLAKYENGYLYLTGFSH